MSIRSSSLSDSGCSNYMTGDNLDLHPYSYYVHYYWTLIHICRLFLDEWQGESDELDHPSRYPNQIGKVQRPMGRWDAWCTLDLSMTSWTSMNKTLFNLAFGTEAIILVKIGLSIMQIECSDEATNMNQLWANLNLLEEIRDRAHLRIAIYW